MSLVDDLDELAGNDWQPLLRERRPVVGPLGRFRSLGAAAAATGIPYSTLRGWCQTGKHGWRYADD